MSRTVHKNDSAMCVRDDDILAAISIVEPTHSVQ